MSRRWSKSLWHLLGGAALSLSLVLVAPAVSAKNKDREAAQASKARTSKVTKRAAPRPSSPARVKKATRPTAEAVRSRKQASRSVRTRVRAVAPVAVPSVGVLAGLHRAEDPLDLKSGVALVVDQQSNEVLLSKNPDAVLPIASITKLMTALVVVESGLALEEAITIDEGDIELASRVRSRLLPGTTITRGELLRLALMASENRAAHTLSRHFPGGAGAFVEAMNRKARELGMQDSRFVEATGLSADNRASAKDLALLVAAASQHDVIRDFSTAKESLVPVGSQERVVQFRSTNGLIGNPEWDISLQKTGYIAAAGRCLVMQASLAGRELTLVLLDSAGKYSRFADAERIRKWLLTQVPTMSATGLLPGSTGGTSLR